MYIFHIFILYLSAPCMFVYVNGLQFILENSTSYKYYLIKTF